MNRSIKQWKQLDVFSQFALLIIMLGSSILVSSYYSIYSNIYVFIPFVIFGLFAINQMGSFFLHRKYAPQYNKSIGRKIYFVILIIHHIVAAFLFLAFFFNELWLSIYYLFFSAIILSLMYLSISIYELAKYKSDEVLISNEENNN